MTCSCGATMCYICRQPSNGYSHFYGQGTQPTAGKCPLYSDTISLHAHEVQSAAENARGTIDEAKRIELTKDLDRPKEQFEVRQNQFEDHARR